MRDDTDVVSIPRVITIKKQVNKMTKYREKLPQLGHRIFLTDGGMETTLIFLQGVELPEFAAITLMDNAEGVQIAVRSSLKV